ncbi:hypothetical protein LWC34_28910 [Kibdelosporangium philippinense]|uniref:DUF6542 domain-containing protein n=1 Tax=Kibdelosporangium philippinense TaxID=211113 RepID=A0ABS8ZG56_9PSEU|nr:DUF6542 domain-containing protein [Kibdelosporangium philippinense]MCE7006818.1 hypothetical protein [Kibdelosporangium philippinense]
MWTRVPLVPGWLAVLGPAAIAVGGLIAGGVFFPLSIILGCVLAAVLAERAAFFAVAVQPPLITAAAVAGAVILGEPLLDGATQLAETFPYLGGTIVAVLVILALRTRVRKRLVEAV